MGDGAGDAVMMERITLRPRIAFAGREPSGAELDDLHHRAHRHCFIANSLKTQIVVESTTLVARE